MPNGDRIVVWKDIEYAALLTPKGEAWCDFVVYEIAGFLDDDSPLYLKDGWTSSSDVVEAVDSAESCAEGYIKWDGCCEFKWDIHVCGMEQARRTGEVMERLYREAADLMPGADRSLMGIA